MRGFRSDAPLPSPSSYDTESVTQYLLPRDEDCENSFHSTADFVSAQLYLLSLSPPPARIKLCFSSYAWRVFIYLSFRSVLMLIGGVERRLKRLVEIPTIRTSVLIFVD